MHKTVLKGHAAYPASASAHWLLCIAWLGLVYVGGGSSCCTSAGQSLLMVTLHTAQQLIVLSKLCATRPAISVNGLITTKQSTGYCEQMHGPAGVKCLWHETTAIAEATPNSTRHDHCLPDAENYHAPNRSIRITTFYSVKLDAPDNQGCHSIVFENPHQLHAFDTWGYIQVSHT